MTRHVAARGLVLGLGIVLAGVTGAYAYIATCSVNRQNHDKVKPPFSVVCSGKKMVTVTVTLTRAGADRFDSAALEAKPNSDGVMAAGLKPVRNKDGTGTIRFKRSREVISKAQLTICFTASSYGGDHYYVDLGSYAAAGERVGKACGLLPKEERAFAVWRDRLLWNRGGLNSVGPR